MIMRYEQSTDTDRSVLDRDYCFQLIKRSLSSAFNEFDRKSEKLLLVKTPVGSGKTTAFIEYCKRNIGNEAVLFVSPTYENIKEIQEKLAGSKVKTAVIKGKVRAGCKYSEISDYITSTGGAAYGLCAAQGKRCPLYEKCTARGQLERALASKPDVIFMVHSFLNKPLPHELVKSIRGIIIDESIILNYLKYSYFDSNLLRNERFANIGQVENEKWRAKLVNLIMPVFDNLKCYLSGEEYDELTGINVASTIVSHDLQDKIQQAIKVCKAAKRKKNNVYPGISLEECRYICNSLTTKEIEEEDVFWNILLEDCQSEITKRLNGIDTTMHYDRRLIPVGNTIRISWKEPFIKSKLPIMVLDATANKQLYEKISNKPVKLFEPITDIGRAFNQKSVLITNIANSISQLDITRAQTPGQRLTICEQMDHLFKILTTIAFKCNSKILVGCTKTIQNLLEENMYLPANIDIAHYGALRGLDRFRGNMAAINVGSYRVPVDVIDALTAAAFWEQNPRPLIYEPGDNDFDRYYERCEKRFRMRNGQDVIIDSFQIKGEYALLISDLLTESEMIQFTGRLRTLRKDIKNGDKVPTWYNISHDGNDMIYDEIIDGCEIVAPQINKPEHLIQFQDQPTMNIVQRDKIYCKLAYLFILFNGVITPAINSQNFPENVFKNLQDWLNQIGMPAYVGEKHPHSDFLRIIKINNMYSYKYAWLTDNYENLGADMEISQGNMSSFPESLKRHQQKIKRITDNITRNICFESAFQRERNEKQLLMLKHQLAFQKRNVTKYEPYANENYEQALHKYRAIERFIHKIEHEQKGCMIDDIIDPYKLQKLSSMDDKVVCVNYQTAYLYFGSK